MTEKKPAEKKAEKPKEATPEQKALLALAERVEKMENNTQIVGKHLETIFGELQRLNQQPAPVPEAPKETTGAPELSSIQEQQPSAGNNWMEILGQALPALLGNQQGGMNNVFMQLVMRDFLVRRQEDNLLHKAMLNGLVNKGMLSEGDVQKQISMSDGVNQPIVDVLGKAAQGSGGNGIGNTS